MDWITITLLVAAGVILMVLEVIFIPGTTVVGILGIISAGIGVYGAYDSFGSTTGTLVLAGVMTVSVGSLILSLRSGMWTRFSLRQQNRARFNEDQLTGLAEGSEGVTVSVLRPMGKASFADKEYEVTSHGNYLSAGQAVRIVKIQHQKIIVEPIETNH